MRTKNLLTLFWILFSPLNSPNANAHGAVIGLNLFKEGDWSQAPAAPSTEITGKKVAVFIHGYSDNLNDCMEMGNFLAQHFDEVLGFNYESTWNLRQLGEQLYEALYPWANENQLILIGHSMGGLVSRYALEQLGLGAQVSHLITLGTPHEGIPSTGLTRFLLPLLKALKFPADSFADMMAEGSFMRELNSGESIYRDKLNYVSIQGSNKNGEFPQHLKKLRGCTKFAVSLMKMPEHDGLVGCAGDENSSLRLKSASWQNYITLNVGHFELKWHAVLFETLEKVISTF